MPNCELTNEDPLLVVLTLWLKNVLVKPALNVCRFVQVGVIACESAGAPSERRKVPAEPFTALSPMVPVGFAAETDEALQSAPKPVMSPLVSTCKHCVEPVIPVSVRLLKEPVEPLIGVEVIDVHCVGAAVAPVALHTNECAAIVGGIVVFS
jgi:hypothetical protein